MLNRILLVVDALLVVALVWLAVRLYAVWTPPSAPPADRPAAAAPAGGAGPTAPPPPPGSRPPSSAFSEIATNNLFNPLRTEETPPPAKPPEKASGPAAPRPRLYGVVLGAEGAARAFLEDPRTRRVTRYAVGDSVADSRLEEIKPDRVVLRRGSEVFEVLLRDPSKPRPIAVPAPPVPGTSGAPGVAAPGFGVPGPGTPGGPAVSPGVAGTLPGGQGTPTAPGFLPVPPTFLPTQPGVAFPGGAPAPGLPGIPVDSGIPPTS